ncbi:MAG: ferredoxin [Candidatus Aenigmatarchaeota archaeon]|nr:MAG: ferredoxin [Candidatus Aenigmarchaeota archaeon]
MRVEVDPDLCIGREVCKDICPELFDIVDDIAVAIDPGKCAELSSCKEAVEACPTNAIRIYSDE